jgi:hypothetical protein
LPGTELRLYDPDRRPANWTEIIRPGQFVAFAKHLVGGGPCDGNGNGFPSSAHITCLIFDGLAEARRFCEEQVQRVPGVRFEIFDAEGRTNPPLLVVVHPAHAGTLDVNPQAMRRRKVAAIVLAVGAVPLFWYDWQSDGLMILPTIVAINMLLAAGRLFQLNMAVSAAERQRQARIGRHE